MQIDIKTYVRYNDLTILARENTNELTEGMRTGVMPEFKIVSNFQMKGDQPEAVDKLVEGVNKGQSHQTLLGVTGSGKTFTMANVIERTQKPTLIISHNKTLAAQLCSEFKEFFPNNCVEYFVSYYDYYQPEAYIARTDTYIEKDSSINDEIDKLRHSATAALFERRDVIIVASVSCIYGLGDPEDYTDLMLSLRPGMIKDRDEVISKLVDLQYERNEVDFRRSKFRVRGDVLEIYPPGSGELVVRVEFFGDEIERISEVGAITGEVVNILQHAAIFPASHYATTREKMERALTTIEEELEERLAELKALDKPIEAYRLEQRTRYDLEMLREIGFCQGIENYSRHISGRAAGTSPYTLMDYFPDDYLIIIDESHVSIPQIGAMYKGDRSRKESLVEYGFRLPSAYDNRPLTFEEFEQKCNQVIFVSATPAVFERNKSAQIVEQLVRPTGILDPEVDVRPVTGQIDDLVGEINERVERNERILVTTLTKRMAESLTDYFSQIDIKVRYLHSDIETLQRTEIIRDLRMGVFDVLVGINLLREGLDLPEVSLVAILDADKEGFLRHETALVQTIGRAARNERGKVIMYADVVTDSMRRAISETNRRRGIQAEYNTRHNITPESIKKEIRGAIEVTSIAEEADTYRIGGGAGVVESAIRRGGGTSWTGKVESDADILGGADIERVMRMIEKLTVEMKAAAKNLEFERAASLRDSISELKLRLPN